MTQSGEEPAPSVPALPGSPTQGVVELYLELVPKVHPGFLQNARPVGLRELNAVLAAYDITVRSAVPGQFPLDRREGAVDSEAQRPSASIKLPREQQIAFLDEAVIATHPDPPVVITHRWRQQAAAIIIAIIAFLTALLPIIK